MSVNVVNKSDGSLKKIAHGFPQSKLDILRADIINNIETTDTASKDYEAGDCFIMQNGQLVEALVDIDEDTTINLTDVREITVEDLINKRANKVSGATNGNFAALDANGNLTDSGWKSDKATTSVSGNPISISGLKSNQLAVNPIITFEPIQAGSGTPSPVNQRPISGYDKIEVLSCGKNIWDGTFGSGTTTTDGKFLNEDGTLGSSGGWGVSNYIRVKGSTSYTISGTTGGGTSPSVCWYDENYNYISGSKYNNVTAKTISLPSNAAFIRFSIHSGSISITQLEESASATNYEPCIKATSISESLGQTVYWVRLNVRTGEFEVLGKILKLNSLAWGYADGYFNVSTGLPADMVTVAILHGYKCYCSKYNAVQKGYLSMQNGELVLGDTGWSSVVRLIVKDTRFSDTTSFENSLTNDDVLVYPLATPFTIQLTPHEISLLKDYAYLSTNGTNIALDYHNGELASLADVSQLGETVNELGEYVKDIYGFKCGTFYVSVTANTRKTITTSEDIVEGTLPTDFGRCVFSLRAANETFPSSGVIMYNKTGETDTIAVLINATNSRLSINWIQFP